MNEKQRLIAVFNGEKVDRPPVICPGGMMNCVVSQVVEDMNENHNINLDAMVDAAKNARKFTGFENYGVPFCMTVEAEPCGVVLDYGSKKVEPRIEKYNNMDLDKIEEIYKINPLLDGRMPIVLEAIKKLKNDEVPVIGNLTGPMSTATSIVDPLKLIKMLRKSPDDAEKFLKYVTDYSIKYVIEMIKNGADVIVMADPTATGEILGKANFERFILPLYKMIVDEVHNMKKYIIIHICGDTKTILKSLDKIGADALSFDSMVSIKYIKSQISTKIMGNVSTQLLQDGDKERIQKITQNCINSGVSIVSPACGLSMSTKIENLKIMTNTVKGRY